MDKALRRETPPPETTSEETAPAPDALPGALAIAVNRLYGATVRAYNAATRDLGLPFEQWLVLDEVARSEAATMGELARALGSNISTLTRIVDRMVGSSLIYRSVDPDDRRRVVLVVTEDGRAMLAAARARAGAALTPAAMREAAAGLPALAALTAAIE